MSLLLRASKTHNLIYSNQRLLVPLIFKNKIITTTKCLNNNPIQEQQSSATSKRFNLKLFLITFAGFGIGLGLTKFNKELRQKVESYVPYSDVAFKEIDSFYENYIQPLISTKKVIEQPDVIPKKIEPIINIEKQVDSNINIEESKSSKVSSNTQTEPSNDNSVLESLNIDTNITNDWKKTLKDHELQEEAAIRAIENKLQNGINDILKKVDDAMKSSQLSIETLKKYSETLKQALDENESEDSKEKEWLQVTKLFEQQSTEVKGSYEKINFAKKAIFDLDRLLVDIKSSDSSKYIQNLKDIQLELIKQYRQLQSDKSKLSEAVVHANVLRSYTNEQKLAREQFLNEIQSLQPEGIKGKLSDDQLSTEELNSLLIHAHKRVLQLQKQINKLQALENQHIQGALEEQRKQFDDIERENVLCALDVQKREFELEKEKLKEDIQKEMDENLKKELARQAAAYNNHLAKCLKTQQDELESLYEKKLQIESQNIKKKFYDKVGKSFGRLKGIEQALLARATLEEQAQNAKELWLAVQNLNEILSSRAIDLKDNLRGKEYKELVEILSNIDMIKKSAPENKFINEILKTLNPIVFERGVWSEPDLRERFHQVKSICRKVALIDERGGSLFKYFLSYLQSKFIINSPINPNIMNTNLELDQSDLNTFKILDYAQYFMEQSDLEMAIKLLQQLDGEPKRIAKEWIHEAILLLEVKQAINLITAHISSVYIGSNLK